MKRRGVAFFFVLLIGSIALFGLVPVVGLAGDLFLRMATTTSTDNTGLLDYLAPGLSCSGSQSALGRHLPSGKTVMWTFSWFMPRPQSSNS